MAKMTLREGFHITFYPFCKEGRMSVWSGLVWLGSGGSGVV